ncbi:MAG: PEGA domain-containing protein [Deltaproteobacteria bacterium]|nr:MAG: PEGA domain-containing protein [Deltaproteobacteria bacterium]
MIVRRAAFAAVAVLLALSPAARARPREGTVAVVSIEITGDGPPEMRDHAHRSLAKGLAAGGLRVIALTDVMHALADSPELIGCRSTTCLQRIGEKVGANYFVRARIEVTGSAYFVELELLSAEVEGALVTRAERSCPVCTVTEVGDLIATAAQEMVELPPAKPVPVRIVTRPPGAVVTVDGVRVGESPHELNLDPGDHAIVAEAPGHVRAAQTVRISESDAEPVVVELDLPAAAAAAPPLPMTPPRRPYRTWKWVAAGAATAAIATGAVLVAVDGDGRCDAAGARCAERYETGGAGAALIAIGAGAGAAAGWMFWRDARDAELTIAPAPGGAAASVRMAF